MRLTKPASILLALPLLVLADVEFTSPEPGATLHGGDVLTALWKDSGEPPRITDLTNYDLFLCAGGPSVEYTEDVALLIEDGSFERGNSVSFQINPNAGATYPNAYFLKMVSKGTNTSVINYSQRFSLSGMTGTFSERVNTGLSFLPNTTGDRSELRKRQLAAAGGGAGGAGGARAGVGYAGGAAQQTAALYAVPYPLQTVGQTKYAPMARHPGTTITAKSAPPQFPTSPYTIATTFLPIPTWRTTLTASQTFSTTSIENPATPAPHPMDDMDKYLRRWVDNA